MELEFENLITYLFRWIHFFAGVAWIGLLYYFNFVQTEYFKETDAAAKSSAISTLVPRALWWFRWGALFTWLTGAAFLLNRGMLHDAFVLGMGGDSINAYAMTIGIGAWLGTIMLFNVWGLIWPNQKKVLGLVEATAEEVAKAKNIAFIASRSNTVMSIPLIMSMVGAGHGFFM